MNINESRAYQAEKDHLMRTEGKHPANYSREEKAQSFNEQRYNAVHHNLDKKFHESDKEFREGKLSKDQYYAKQAAQEKESDQYISDLSSAEKDKYAGNMIDKYSGNNEFARKK